MKESIAIAKRHLRSQDRQQNIELLKIVISDPLIVGLLAMVANEAAYQSGFYNPSPQEVGQSILGGPTWITIGPSLPVAQQKRNLLNGMIIGVTTAKALAPAMPLLAQGLKGALNMGAVV